MSANTSLAALVIVDTVANAKFSSSKLLIYEPIYYALVGLECLGLG